MPKTISERDEALAERIAELTAERVIDRLSPLLEAAGIAIAPAITDIINRELGAR